MQMKELFKPKQVISAAVVSAMLLSGVALANQSAALDDKKTEDTATEEAYNDTLVYSGESIKVSDFWNKVKLTSTGQFVYDPGDGEEIRLSADDLATLVSATGKTQSAMANKLNSIQSSTDKLNEMFSGSSGDTEGMFDTIQKQLGYLATINGYSSNYKVPANIDFSDVDVITEGQLYVLGSGAHTRGRDVQDTPIVVECVKVNSAETYDGEETIVNDDGSKTIKPIHITTPSSATFQTFGLTYGTWPGNGDLSDELITGTSIKYRNLFGNLSPYVSGIYLPSKDIPSAADNVGNIATTEFSDSRTAMMNAISHADLYGLPATAGAWYINTDKDNPKMAYYMTAPLELVANNGEKLGEQNQWKTVDSTETGADKERIICPYFTISDLSNVTVTNGLIETTGREPVDHWIDINAPSALGGGGKVAQCSRCGYYSYSVTPTAGMSHYGDWHDGGYNMGYQYVVGDYDGGFATAYAVAGKYFNPLHTKYCPECGIMMQ